MVFTHFPDSSVASSWSQPTPQNKVVPVYSIKAYGKVEVYFHSFLSLALGEGSQLNYAAPSTLWQQCCGGPCASLDIFEMRKISYPTWELNDSLVVENVDFSLQQFAIPPVTT